MHGHNELRPYESRQDGLLQVQDIWLTIQGEGPFFGMPAIFVRLTGCNLACHFCDTVWDDKNDALRSVAAIMNQIHNLSVTAHKPLTKVCNLVVITGGEPLRQNLKGLIKALAQEEYQIQIETAGTYWQDCLTDENVVIVCSPKTKHVHPKIKQHCRHWKYVTRTGETSPEDGLPNQLTQRVKGDNSPLQTLQKYGVPARPGDNSDNTVWLTPCDEGDDNQLASEENARLVGELSLRFGYRAQVQMHKYLRLP